jgi:hypothetical protein
VTIRFHQRNEPVGKPRGYARTYQVVRLLISATLLLLELDINVQG